MGAGADADRVHRAVADVVIEVADEVFRWELPVASDTPLLHAADELRTAVGTVAVIQGRIQVVAHVAEVVQEGRRLRVPGRPDRALVVVDLGNALQPPGALVEFALVVGGIPRHAMKTAWTVHQRPVGRERPAVIGAGEPRAVALVVAAQLHSAVRTGVEQHVDLVLPVSRQDHLLRPHPGNEIVVGAGDQAFVPHEKPGPAEDLLLLLPVEIFVDEDLPCDHAAV